MYIYIYICIFIHTLPKDTASLPILNLHVSPDIVHVI